MAKLEETHDQMISRLTDEYMKLLTEQFPEKGSSLQQIEDFAEEVGNEMRQRSKDGLIKLQETEHYRSK